MTFKKFAVGFAIFILTILFMVFVQRAFLPKPKNTCIYRPTPITTYDSTTGSYVKPATGYSTDNSIYQTCQQKYQDDLKRQKQSSFILIMGMSVFVIIAGVLIMSVPTVSWGLILAGLVMITYVLIANFEEVGKPWRAVITGFALVILIWIAYAKLGEDEPPKEDKDDRGVQPMPPANPSNTGNSPNYGGGNPPNYGGPNSPNSSNIGKIGENWPHDI